MPTQTVSHTGDAFTEQLRYSNPLNQKVEPIWYRNERYFVVNTDTEVSWTQKPQVPVREYRFRFGSPGSPGPFLAEQDPVYSLIPGSFHYQPVVELVEVFVPDEYQPNSIKSHTDILKSNYQLAPTERCYVRPVI